MKKAPQAADKGGVIIGCIALGIVMLIWVLTWEPSDGQMCRRRRARVRAQPPSGGVAALT